jgi:hypothetical protein
MSEGKEARLRRWPNLQRSGKVFNLHIIKSYPLLEDPQKSDRRPGMVLGKTKMRDHVS